MRNVCLSLLLALAVPSFAAEPAAAPAATASVDALVRSVEAKYAGVEVLRAGFVQTTRSALYGDEKQRGTLVLERPSKMRWEFEGDGKLFVADGTTMWIFNAADKQVIRFTDYAAQASGAESVLQALDKVSQRFDVTLVSSDPVAGSVLSLQPKAGEAPQFKKLLLVLDAALVLRKVEITDPFDTVTEIEFSDVKLGGDLPADTFLFRVPDGVEVIDAGS